ncbi:MAG: hypothetical protein R3C14_32090 [Caldilineaceae bacterium]
MTEKLIGNMDHFDFEQMIESFIDRPVAIDEPIPAELVFTMLDQAEQPSQVLALESIMIDDRLVISAPASAIVPDNVREIELNLLNVRLIVKVEPLPA